MRNNLFALIIGAIIMAIILLTCNGGQEIKTVTKTEYIKGKETIKWDTIKKTITEIHTNMEVDTFFAAPGDTNPNMHVFVYPVKDSLLEGTIKATAEIKPQIDFDYKLTLPELTKTVSRVDTFKITNDNYIFKSGFYLGGETSINPFAKQFSATGDYVHKKGWIFGYRFEHPFEGDNTHNIKIGKKIF